MKAIFTRQNEEKLKEIRQTLIEEGEVEVHSQYETVYGCGFDSWLREGIADIKCDIKETSYNHFGWGYPWTYEITLKK